MLPWTALSEGIFRATRRNPKRLISSSGHSGPRRTGRGSPGSADPSDHGPRRVPSIIPLPIEGWGPIGGVTGPSVLILKWASGATISRLLSKRNFSRGGDDFFANNFVGGNPAGIGVRIIGYGGGFGQPLAKADHPEGGRCGDAWSAAGECRGGQLFCDTGSRSSLRFGNETESGSETRGSPILRKGNGTGLENGEAWGCGPSRVIRHIPTTLSGLD